MGRLELEPGTLGTLTILIVLVVFAAGLGNRVRRRFMSMARELKIHKTERFKLEELCSALDAKSVREVDERRLELEAKNGELRAKSKELETKCRMLEAEVRLAFEAMHPVTVSPPEWFDDPEISEDYDTFRDEPLDYFQIENHYEAYREWARKATSTWRTIDALTDGSKRNLEEACLATLSAGAKIPQ